MFNGKLKQFILLSLSFFAVFDFVLPVIFLITGEIHESGFIAGTFCVDKYSQILNGLLSKPDHILNVWLMYYTATGYCGTPFYYGATVLGYILLILLTIGLPLLISMLLAFLLMKVISIQTGKKNKQKLYLTFFIAVIIFLAIRYIKNGFSNPLLLEFGGDPLVDITPHLTYPAAVLQAFLQGPGGILDRTDPQVYTAALFTSLALDALVSLIGGYIIATLIIKSFVKKTRKNKN